MSDDLVKQLRERSRQYADNEYNFDKRAADRIEKLEAALHLYTCGCTAICENYHIDATCGYSAREALEKKDD